MAAVNSLIGFMYEVVQSSWMVATVVMKYFIAGVILRSIQLNDTSIESLGNHIHEYGRYAVLGTGALGLVSTLLSMKFQPLFLFPSQLVAVGVLGYLFWKY